MKLRLLQWILMGCVFLSSLWAEVVPFSAADRVKEAEAALWNTPVFQKRFKESYLSETQVEPALSEREYKTMMKFLDYLGKIDESVEEDKPKAIQVAIKFIKGKVTPAGSAVFDFSLANLYWQTEEFEKAIPLYESAIEKFSKFRRAYKNLGLILAQTGEHEKALSYLAKVIDLGGGDISTYSRLASVYFEVGDYINAESAYRMSALLDPEQKNWKFGIIYSMYKQQRFNEAVAMCDVLIAKYPEDADVWMMQADAFYRLNKPMKAAINYEMVDRMGKATDNSLLNLGNIYVNEDLYDTAVGYYLRAFPMDPNREGKFNQMVPVAKAFTARSAFPEADKILGCIREVMGDRLTQEQDIELLRIDARLAAASGNLAGETDVLDKIVALNPRDGQALILLGQNCEKQEEYERAVFNFERAARIEKFEADAKMRHGQMLVRMGKYRDALPLLKRSQELKPRDALLKYIEQVERVSKLKS